MDKFIVLGIVEQLSLGKSPEEIINSLRNVKINKELAGKVFQSSTDPVLSAGVLIAIFSPKSLIISNWRIQPGITQMLIQYYQFKTRFQATYRIRVAKDLYRVDKVFRSEVDKLAKEVQRV